MVTANDDAWNVERLGVSRGLRRGTRPIYRCQSSSISWRCLSREELGNTFETYMSLIYLDQNALINLGRLARDTPFRDKLDEFTNRYQMQFVLSWWHLVESSYGDSDRNSEELAAFAQSLRPLWLLERFDILRLDVAEDFSRYAGIDYICQPRIRNFDGMLASFESKRTPGSIPFQGDIIRFVKLWRRHRLRQGQASEEVFNNAGDQLMRLRLHQQSGAITPAMVAAAQRTMLQHVAPTTTPSGLTPGRELMADYIHKVNPAGIRAIALETVVSVHQWTMKRLGAARNSLIDNFVVVSAAPYVDVIVSDDHFFYEVYPAVQQTGHARARLLHNQDLVASLR